MKVIRLRSHYGVPALKGEQSWGEGDPGTELRALPNGHFVVSKYGKHVLIPGAAVVSADVEPAPQQMFVPNGGPLTADHIENATEIVKRAAGRPRKEQPT